jgi:hypothetical protein
VSRHRARAAAFIAIGLAIGAVAWVGITQTRVHHAVEVAAAQPGAEPTAPEVDDDPTSGVYVVSVVTDDAAGPDRIFKDLFGFPPDDPRSATLTDADRENLRASLDAASRERAVEGVQRLRQSGMSAVYAVRYPGMPPICLAGSAVPDEQGGSSSTIACAEGEPAGGYAIVFGGPSTGAMADAFARGFYSDSSEAQRAATWSRDGQRAVTAELDAHGVDAAALGLLMVHGAYLDFATKPDG